ncbi:MAG: T9SS type A sorting domain-containing protein [Bacteroidetes bacterium]|nr:MAG: T9SS type A sorting domain-containing protein [Bacteroidota bacterium]
MKKIIILILFNFSFALCQLPNPALIGYWHNWDDVNAPYIPITLIDSRYNVINVAFAVPKPPEDFEMEFNPVEVDSSVLINQINFIQGQGKKVIISIGGGNSPIILNDEMEMNTFVSTMNQIINTYNFDGIDIDLEGNSLFINGGTISEPTDKPVQYMIEAIKKIMSDYYFKNGKRLLLTMAPQTANVQGGMESFAGVWGAYLPVIDALRDSIEVLHVQLYNSGSMRGIDGNIYNQGTADFIGAMTEQIIRGFDTPGGYFRGLAEDKIAVGLPACASAASGGYTDTATVKLALDYLMGKGPKPGYYTLINSAGYPKLRGMMTWSINWDVVNTCHSTYEYAENYERIFNTETGIIDEYSEETNSVNPNPFSDYISITIQGDGKAETIIIYDLPGRVILKQQTEFLETGKTSNFHIPTETLISGVYFVNVQGTTEMRMVVKN